MTRNFSDTELDAYLDEALAAELMTEVEGALRGEPKLLERLSSINARRDAGIHSLGEIWRRNRLTCPSRSQLGNHLLRVLPDDEAAYIDFHIEEIGCRACQANLNDMKSQQAESAHKRETRRRKYFQSSAGYLKSGG